MFIVFYPNVGHSCKCSVDPSELLQHPENAPVAIVGKIVESKGYYSLVLVKNWSEGIEKIKLSAGKSCDPSGLKIGANYILLAKGTSREMPYANSCTSILIELSESREVIKKLTKKNFVGEINPSWQFCEANTECIRSKNECGNLIGVNQKYLKNYLSFLRIKKKKTECSNSVSEVSNISRCVESFCN